MRRDQGSLRWKRQAVGFLAVSILTCGILTAAQHGNQAAAGDAAMVGQRVPGRSSPTDVQGKDGAVQPATEDPLQARQQRELRRLRFEQMKKQASQLAEMADSLQQDIQKSNENIFSIEVSEKAKKIQKLAGKIRSEARY